LSRLAPAEVDINEYWYLTKQKTLRACTPLEATTVANNNGVLYHPEQANTILVLVFKGEVQVLKDIARSPGNYSVEMDIRGLSWDRAGAWGLFERRALQRAQGDCEKLCIEHFLEDPAKPQPVYFQTASVFDKDVKTPEIVRAQLIALRVLDKNGKQIGAYKGEIPDLPVATMPDMPVEPPTPPLVIPKNRNDALAQLRKIGAGIGEDPKLGNARILSVNIRHLQVRDWGAEIVANLTEVQILDLTDAGVTDAGLKHLVRLGRLKELILHDNKGISDASLDSLSELKELRELDLYGTSISGAGVRRLQKTLPKCRIYHDF
jgi:hypothetical protein